jgi:hypothetical protein
VRRTFGSWIIDVFCGFVAYVGARWIYGPKEGAFSKLHWELLTFAALWLILQVLVRGRRLARQGR